MGILRKFSRNVERSVKEKSVSTRLTEKEFEAFSKLCEETGYSLSEAMRLLIQQEISEVNEQVKTKSIQSYTENIQSSSKSIPNVDQNKPKSPNVNKSKQISKF